MFVSEHERSETGYLCEGSLDDPASSVPSPNDLVLTLVMSPVLLVRGNERDPLSLQGPPQPVLVIGFVRNEPFRTISCSSFSGFGNMDIVQRRLSQSNFGRRCRIEQTAQRDTRAIDNDHPLSSFAAFGLSDSKTPFFAGAKLPSMNVSSHLRAFLPSSIDRNARQISLKTPWSCQSFSRRS